MHARRDAEFTEFVEARLMSLRRAGFLLCGDWDRADDLVQAAITKLYVHWGRAQAEGPYFVADAGLLRASQYTLAARGQNAPWLTTNPARRGVTCHLYPDGQSRRETINGYRVIVDRLPAVRGNPVVRQVCAADADGLFVFVSTYGRSRPDATGLFAHHLRLLGPDPANWTTRPVT